MKLLFLGIAVAYNPFYMLRLMQEGGLGGMSLRIALSSMFLLPFGYFASIIYLMRNRKGFQIDKSPLFMPMNGLLLLFGMAFLIGLIKQHDSTWFILDSFALLEMFGAYYFIKFAPFSLQDKDWAKIIKWFGVYLVLMCIVDITIYIYLTFVQGLSFGSIRANIGGVPVNRLMDFLMPVFLPVAINYFGYSNKKYPAVILIILSFIVTMLTFWRTPLVASLAGILSLAIQQKKKFLLNFSKIALVLMTVIISLSVVQESFSLRIEGIDLTSLAGKRFVSAFVSGGDNESGTDSGAPRITNYKEMLMHIPKVLAFGYGIGGSYEDSQGGSNPIQISASYFLEIMLLMGVPAALLFVWIFGKTFLLSFSIGRTANTDLKRFLFSSYSSILASLAVILMLFPYTVYFPLLYIFGLICGITDRIASQEGSKTKELSRCESR